jgi:hypothetical protein
MHTMSRLIMKDCMDRLKVLKRGNTRGKCKKQICISSSHYYWLNWTFIEAKDPTYNSTLSIIWIEFQHWTRLIFPRVKWTRLLQQQFTFGVKNYCSFETQYRLTADRMIQETVIEKTIHLINPLKVWKV